MDVEKTAEKIREKLEGLSSSELVTLMLGLAQNQKYEAAEPTSREPREVSDEEKAKRMAAKQASDRIRLANRANRGRLKKMKYDKETCPLSLAEAQFIGEQRARGNSEETIKGYQRVFKKFYVFLAYHYGEIDGAPIWKLDKPQEELVEIGSMFALSVLEADDLIDDFRWYITEIDASSEITANYYIRHLKAVVKYFAEEEVIEDRKIVIKDIKPSIKDVYTDEELRKLLRSPKDEDDFTECRNWTMIQFLMGTGCRIATLTAVRVGDVDFDNNLITLNRQKNGTPTVIRLQQASLAPALRKYINGWRTDEEGNPKFSEQLFCRSDGEEATIGALKKAVASFNTSRGVSKTSCHLFRHTFAKRWILAGKSEVELMKVLNHKSMKMVEHYANLWGRDTQKDIDEASLLSQVKKPTGKKMKPTQKLQRRK